MNSQLIRTLPMDVQREVYTYLPIQNCIVCNDIVINYSTKSSHTVCSMHCLYIFNQRMISEIALHRVVVPIFNMYVACNYIYKNYNIYSIYVFIFRIQYLCSLLYYIFSKPYRSTMASFSLSLKLAKIAYYRDW